MVKRKTQEELEKMKMIKKFEKGEGTMIFNLTRIILIFSLALGFSVGTGCGPTGPTVVWTGCHDSPWIQEGTASININSEPGNAKVYVNDVFRGYTPTTISFDFSAAWHRPMNIGFVNNIGKYEIPCSGRSDISSDDKVHISYI